MQRHKIMQMARLAGQVRRYHTWPVIHQQTVGEHTWQVLRMYIQIWGSPSPEVTVYIVAHDAGEFHAGDLPWSSKKNDPKMKELMDRKESEGRLVVGMPQPEIPEVEKWRVKICDVIELWEFGMTEVAMGNGFAECVVLDPLRFLKDDLFPRVSEQDRELVTAYIEATTEKYSNARD